MKNPQKAYKNASERLDQYIRAKNMRPSKERLLVLERICFLPQPFTAKDLEDVCEEERISVGTIYNTLKLLVTAQILHAVVRQRGRAVTEYELALGNQMRIQMKCLKCGREVELRDKLIDRMVKERPYSNFNMQYYSLYIYGECKLCRRLVEKNKTEKKKV